MNVHVLKCWPEPFRAIAFGIKRHEFRINDRDFQVGDVLHLVGFDPDGGRPLMEPGIFVPVLYITHGPAFGVPAGYCVMSIGEQLEGGIR